MQRKFLYPIILLYHSSQHTCKRTNLPLCIQPFQNCRLVIYIAVLRLDRLGHRLARELAQEFLRHVRVTLRRRFLFLLHLPHKFFVFMSEDNHGRECYVLSVCTDIYRYKHLFVICFAARPFASISWGTKHTL